MNTELRILIVADTYAETTSITPLLREQGHIFTLITVSEEITKCAQITDFDSLFISIAYLKQATSSALIALKSIPAHTPIFFIVDTPSDSNSYTCSGFRAIDTVNTSTSLKPDMLRCLRITEHMKSARPAPFRAGGIPLKPLYAQLSNIRMLHKLMREEVSRERLIKQTCNNMAQVAGYQHVWINLLQEHGGYRTHSGGADIDTKTGTPLTSMPRCVKLEHLHLPQIVANYEGDCSGCSFHREAHNHACLYHPIKHKSGAIGELCVLIDLHLVGNPDFMIMFREMINNLACAISLLTNQHQQRSIDRESTINASVSLSYIRQLEQADQRFHALFREMPRVAVQGYNKNREVIFWNKASEEFYGYSEAEALGVKIEDLIMPDFMADFAIQAIKDWDEKGIPIPAAECALKHKDEHLVPVFSSHAGFKNLTGDFEMYCLDISLSEINEAKEAAKKLSKFPSENPNPVLRLNEQGELIYANPASTRLLNVWNKNIGDVIPNEYLQYANKATKEQRVHYHLIQCEEKTFNTAFTPINHGANYLNIYAMDVTDREDAFKELQTAKQAAEAANLAKNDFLANMSHELRTPLNGIMGMAQLLEHSILSTEQYEEVDSIIASAHTLLNVITDILDISAIERNKITVKEEPFNLKKLVQHAMKMITPTAQRKKINVIFNYPTDKPESFTGDKQHISQTVINLLSNAAKFTKNGSITVNVEVHAHQVQLDVIDTGIGIPADKTNFIFEKFTQIDSSKSREYGGAGLGLNISKHLVERMNGKISVKSKEGEGATFTITLPLKAAPEPNTDKATSKQKPSRNRNLRILLAEDNHINQLVAKKMLNSLGCIVDIANDGQQALERAQSTDYDLIFMDIQMPQTNGLTATHAIRKLDGARGKVPIIALTAHTMRDDIKACSDAKMNNYLAKPINYDDLDNLLNTFFPPTETGT